MKRDQTIILKRIVFLVVVFAATSGCVTVTSPAIGMFFSDVQYGSMATTNTDTSKTGTACATSILGLIATGDASITAAKANGGITHVATVEHSTQNLFGLVGKWCTVVKGN